MGWAAERVWPLLSLAPFRFTRLRLMPNGSRCPSLRGRLSSQQTSCVAGFCRLGAAREDDRRGRCFDLVFRYLLGSLKGSWHLVGIRQEDFEAWVTAAAGRVVSLTRRQMSAVVQPAGDLKASKRFLWVKTVVGERWLHGVAKTGHNVGLSHLIRTWVVDAGMVEIDIGRRGMRRAGGTRDRVAKTRRVRDRRSKGCAGCAGAARAPRG